MTLALGLQLLIYILFAIGTHGYGADLEDTGLAIAYNGSLTGSYTCQNQVVDLGSYNQSYIIAGAPLRTSNSLYGTYGDTWEKNPVHFGLFHSSTEGGFVTEDYIYGLQFSTAAWVTDETSLYNTTEPGERILDLSASGVEIMHASVGGQPGYMISGDQRSVDTSAVQPNGVGLDLIAKPGLPEACGRVSLIFNWTQSTPFNYSMAFSNTTAWFNLVTDVGNDTTVTMNLNATRVLDDSVVRFSNVALESSNTATPMFSQPSTSTTSYTYPAAAATSSSAASPVSSKTRVEGMSLLLTWGGIFVLSASCALPF